jgi:MraZ protein
MLLTGTFFRAIDDKLRIAIPKHFRPVLVGESNAPVYAAPGMDGSLGIYSEPAFQALADRLNKASPTGREVLAFGRLFYARAQALELDAQGRIRLPTDLATWAGITKDAVLIGVNDHLELWDKQRWDVYVADKQPKFDEFAESAFKT